MVNGGKAGWRLDGRNPRALVPLLVVMCSTSAGWAQQPAARPPTSCVGVPDARPVVAIVESPAATPSIWMRKPLATEGFAAIGGKHTLAGAGVDWSLSTGFSLHAGAGFSASPGAPMADLMGRLRLVVTPTIGAGAEAGFVVDRYEAKDDCTAGGCRVWTWDTALWGKVGVHVETRTTFGLTLRVSAGATSIFNMADARCTHCETGEAPRLWTYSLPYFAVAAGWVIGS